MDDGCPVCDWDGEVARTHDYRHAYYTHIIVTGDGDMFKGPTCTEPTRPPRNGLVSRVLGWLR